MHEPSDLHPQLSSRPCAQCNARCALFQDICQSENCGIAIQDALARSAAARGPTRAPTMAQKQVNSNA